MIFYKYYINYITLLLRVGPHISQYKSQSPFNDVSLVTGLHAAPGTFQACSYFRAFALAALAILTTWCSPPQHVHRGNSLKPLLRIQLPNKAHLTILFKMVKITTFPNPLNAAILFLFLSFRSHSTHLHKSLMYYTYCLLSDSSHLQWYINTTRTGILVCFVHLFIPSTRIVPGM